MVSITRILPTLSRARADVAFATALGLEHGRIGAQRNRQLHGRRGQPRSGRTAQPRRGADLPQVSGVALSVDALSLQRRPRNSRDGPADYARLVAALS